MATGLDDAGLARLLQEQQKAIREAEEGLKSYQLLEKNYKQLDKSLDDLPQKLSHDVTVPINGVGFLLGRLIHTNEIMVLLSSQYMVQVSATTAKKIVEHRLDQCRKRQAKALEEVSHFRNWKNFTQPFREDEVISKYDIREDYDEENEQKWRAEHAQRVKESKMKSQSAPDEGSYEAVMQRLEELEMEEEMAKYSEKIKAKPQVRHPEEAIVDKPVDHSLKSILKKSPSVESDQKSVRFPDQEKPILDSDDDDYDEDEDSDEAQTGRSLQNVTAFTGEIVERPVSVPPQPEPENMLRPSRFKMSRTSR